MVDSSVQAKKSFIEYSSEHHFPLENIPFGVFENPKSKEAHCCSRIGDFVIDLAVLGDLKKLSAASDSKNPFRSSSLNSFIALGKDAWHSTRVELQELFDAKNAGNKDALAEALFPAGEAKLLLPVQVGDYTDFYSSKNHAYNVGVMVRGPDNALQPNWLHLPVGYHGRASSIVVSGTPIQRPKG